MKNPMKKRLPLFNRLSVRVFVTIWLSMALIISLTLFIPRFDQRRVLLTPEKEQIFYATKVSHMLFSIPSDRYLDYKDDAQLLAIPDEISERYNAIHRLSDEEIINFIVNTLPTGKTYQQEINGREIIGPIRFNNDPNAYYLSVKALHQSYYLNRLYDAPVLIFILMLLISLPFAGILSWSLSLPMKNLRKATERISKGDWSVDKYLESRGPIEYRYLAKSLNHMIETLNAARHEKNRLFANLSHELRTPLTRIHLANSLIRIKNIDAVTNEVKRINDNLLLVEDRIQAMLALSKQTILNHDLVETLDLSELLTPLLEDAAFEAVENNKELLFDSIPDTKIEVNAELFHSGLENIIRNAIHYASSKIVFSVKVIDQQLMINVHDDGPGILEKDLPQIFEPFYRGDRPEGFQDYGGSGLGLAIVNQMVQSHRGTVKAENDHGLSITIQIPLSQSPNES